MHFTIYFCTDWAVLKNTLLIRNIFSLFVKILTVREKRKKCGGYQILQKYFSVFPEEV